jgi:hypothetical protein
MVRLGETLRTLSLLLYGNGTDRASKFWRFPLTEAETRSFELLNSCLSPAQRDQYEMHRYFDVIGSDTGAKYRIRHGSQMNVERLDQKGLCLQLLCFMPEDGLPIGDVMLAQKIALELFESEAISVANKSPHWYLEYEARFGRRFRDRH